MNTRIVGDVRTRLVLVLLLVVPLAACQGRTSFFEGGGGGSGGGGRNTGRASGGQVSLSARDLAPVDAFISARNAQWIVGDEVVVLASIEYFSQYLTVNTTIGLIDRTDTTRPDATTVELRYKGADGTASVTTSPRVMIGTGLTIMARRKLTVRLQGTKDKRLPVVLRVQAQGDASRGRKDDVQERGPSLLLGGELRATGCGHQWVPYR